jgi:hypothetical protein
VICFGQSDQGLSLGSSGVDDLLLEVGGLGEAEGDLVGGESVVTVGDGINSALHDLLVKGVEVDLLVSLAVGGHSLGSSADVAGEALKDKVLIKVGFN